MKIVMVHGSPRKGNTYLAAQLFLDEMKRLGSVSSREFFLPQDLPEFCRGCAVCILKSEELCPHARYVQPVLQAMLEADALIFTTPVFVLSESGGMKAFLDHFGFLFLPHRPRPEMFRKKAFLLSTTAGAGTRSAMKPIAESLRFWGVNRIFTRGFALHEISWNKMPEKRRAAFERRIRADAGRFYRETTGGTIRRPYFKIQFMFQFCKRLIRSYPEDNADRRYWRAQGWLEKGSPFRRP